MSNCKVIAITNQKGGVGKTTADTLRQGCGGILKIFKTEIPVAVKAAETGAVGKSIFAYDKNSKVAAAYAEFAKEVLADGERQRNQAKHAHGR